MSRADRGAIAPERKLAGDEAPNAGDALLAVKDFESVAGDVEVDEAKRVPLEQRVDHGDVALAVVVDVVALVLRLDHELPSQSEQALALKLVVHETFRHLLDGVLRKLGPHRLTFRRMKSLL